MLIFLITQIPAVFNIIDAGCDRAVEGFEFIGVVVGHVVPSSSPSLGTYKPHWHTRQWGFCMPVDMVSLIVLGV